MFALAICSPAEPHNLATSSENLTVTDKAEKNQKQNKAKLKELERRTDIIPQFWTVAKGMSEWREGGFVFIFAVLFLN